MFELVEFSSFGKLEAHYFTLLNYGLIELNIEDVLLKVSKWYDARTVDIMLKEVLFKKN